MARHSNNLDGLSRYEVLLVFNSLVLNSELSTLLREKGLYYVDSRIEDYADGSSAFFLIFKKEGEEGSCQVQFKDTVVAGSLNDKQIIRSLKDFFQLNEGVQYHIHVTRNLSKMDDMLSIRVISCLTNDEYTKTPIAQKKEIELRNIKEGIYPSSEGWTRFTVICDKEIVDKIKALSKLENFTIREIVEKYLSDGIKKYEARYAPICINEKNRKDRRINDIL